jgi:MYXO-CTERM domain-containing protein
MGERVRAVGYGLTNDGSKLNVDGSPYRFRRDALTIVELGPDQAQGVTATELLLGESICDGDSGGPLLDETSGAILGTVSRGGNGTSFQDYRGCVDTNGNPATNVYTRVDKFAGLVTQALGDVGEVPTPEASGNAVDPDAGAPQDDAAGAPSASSAASSSGGCATAPAGGSSRLAFMLALAALFATRRRRGG